MPADESPHVRAPAIDAEEQPRTTRRTVLIVSAVVLVLVVFAALHLTGVLGGS